MEKPRIPESLIEAVRYFKDPDTCIAFMVALRWPNGEVTCPNCGSKEVRYLATRRLWECKTRPKHPKAQFSAKVGTIMEDSAIGLDKWLPAMWQLANCKNGISSYELAKNLRVTQKTAWFMLHRIRLAMQSEDGGGKLGGPGSTVEVDETYIGGAARMMNSKRRKVAVKGGGSPYATPRAIVLGMLERGGRVRLKHLSRATRWDLFGGIAESVEPGSAVHTDELSAYRGLETQDYGHQVVNHSETYVAGNVHTNGIENFWSLLKRGIRGTYVSVEPFHLFRYLDEQAFRFNARKGNDAGRFVGVLDGIHGRRVTYKALTGMRTVARPA